ncbi:MAG TPA: hypothetical protein VJ417_00305, partial [Candidatus Glassbacteria bacterium]|nr:hypothetical protein [Candidatus Glassbacteria bacterium]
MVYQRIIILLYLPLILLLAAFSIHAAGNEAADEGGYYTVVMGASLWETLIDNGVNPTLWKEIFQFNRENNPAFRRISNANRIPRGTPVYIPLEGGEAAPAAPGPSGRGRAAIADTVRLMGGIPFLKISSPGRLHVDDVIRQFCIPAKVTGKRERANLLRSLRADIRDTYRLAGLAFSYRDRTFYIPVHYTAHQYEALGKRLSALYGSP